MRNHLQALLLLGLLVGCARAETLAIVGGDIYPISDPVIRGGVLILENGKIARLGIGLAVPEGATVIDAKGKCVLPGLVAMQLSGVTGGAASTVAGSFDPYGQSVGFALASGITAGYVSGGDGGGGGGRFGRRGGRGVSTTNAVLKMAEGALDGYCLREPAMATISWTYASGSDKAELRRSLREAAAYLRDKAQFERDKAAGKKVEEPKEPRDAATSLQLLRGEIPARVAASSAGEILQALELHREFGIHLVLEGVLEGWLVAADIAAADADAIVTPRALREVDEALNRGSGSRNELAAILRHAGVHVAILPGSAGFSTGGDFGGDLFTLPFEAAHAVGGGLDEASALAAITLEPARMLGVADRVGSLEPGKDADVIVMNGHPLDYRALVDVTIVDGKVRYERSKMPWFSNIGAED